MQIYGTLSCTCMNYADYGCCAAAGTVTGNTQVEVCVSGRSDDGPNESLM